MGQWTFDTGWFLLRCSTTSGTDYPVGPAFSTDEIALVRCTLEVVELGSQGEVAGGVEFGNAITSMSSETTVGSYATTVGFHFPTGVTNVESTAQANQLARFLLRTKLTSGSTAVFVYVRAKFEVTPQ